MQYHSSSRPALKIEVKRRVEIIVATCVLGIARFLQNESCKTRSATVSEFAYGLLCYSMELCHAAVESFHLRAEQNRKWEDLGLTSDFSACGCARTATALATSRDVHPICR